MRFIVKKTSALLLLAMLLSSCGAVDRANNNLDQMNVNMRNMQQQMSDMQTSINGLEQQGQALTGEAHLIRESFEVLVTSMVSMSGLMQEVMRSAVTFLFPEQHAPREQVSFPSADDVFDSLEEDPSTETSQTPTTSPTTTTQPQSSTTESL